MNGVLALHDQQPFSVADALPSTEILEQLCLQLVEVHLLAVKPGLTLVERDN